SKNNEVITEEELSYMSSEEFDDSLSSYKLFLNFPPQMFNKVVSDKKSSGKIVAISAESTNDLAAMKSSNVSFVIKGENSEMIKQASDVVLNSGGFDKINNVFSASKKIYRRIHSICEYNVYNYVSIFFIFFIGLVFDLQYRGYDFLVASVFISGIISFYLSTISMPKKHKYTIPKKRKKSVDLSEFSLAAILGIECSVCSSLLCIIFNGESTPAIFLICYSTFSILAAITILNDGIPFYKYFIGINLKALITIIVILIIISALMFFPPFISVFSYGTVSLNALAASLILPCFVYAFNIFALKRFKL
ncbi:MAG: cation-transporting P-type ATPase, partial [Clostridia bacterium]|nr:cation-transporting P-type ATPase [Clostridia bacterium]